MKSNMFKRLVLLISSTFLVLICAALPATVRAQTWYNQNPFEWYVKVYDENTFLQTKSLGKDIPLLKYSG